MGTMLTTNIYIVVVVIWTASLIYRSAIKQMNRASFMTGLILIGWAVMHLLVYQTGSTPVLSRHLWYSYSFFELSLPLVLLWLAYAIDKPDDKISIPSWMRIMIVINIAISILCVTNDLHLLVTPLDVNDPNWKQDYSYAFGFYFWQAGWVIPFLLSVFIMLKKIGKYVRKRVLLFLMIAFALLLAYQYGYNNRIPVIWETDRVIINGIFVLFFVEIIIRSGLIPVNTKYQALFTHSPLGIRIVDESKKAVLNSENAMSYDSSAFAGALGSYPEPLRQDENTFLFAVPITGGYAMWQEDISGINRLHKEIEESVLKLKVANSILMKEEKIERFAREEIEKTQLMAQLDAEIKGFTIRMSTMVEQLENATDQPKAKTRIMLLLCYIKRRCNLFFHEKEAETFSADELTVYFDELAEMAGYSGVRIIVTSELVKDIEVRAATLIYDLFYSVIYWATWASDPYILTMLSSDDGNTTIRMLPSEDARTFEMRKDLQKAITAAGGTFAVKDLDDAVGLSLTFPERGEGNG